MAIKTVIEVDIFEPNGDEAESLLTIRKREEEDELIELQLYDSLVLVDSDDLLEAVAKVTKHGR